MLNTMSATPSFRGSLPRRSAPIATAREWHRAVRFNAGVDKSMPIHARWVVGRARMPDMYQSSKRDLRQWVHRHSPWHSHRHSYWYSPRRHDPAWHPPQVLQRGDERGQEPVHAAHHGGSVGVERHAMAGPEIDLPVTSAVKRMPLCTRQSCCHRTQSAIAHWATQGIEKDIRQCICRHNHWQSSFPLFLLDHFCRTLGAYGFAMVTC